MNPPSHYHARTIGDTGLYFLSLCDAWESLGHTEFSNRTYIYIFKDVLCTWNKEEEYLEVVKINPFSCM